MSRMNFKLYIEIAGNETESILRWSFEGYLEGLASKLDRRLIDHIAWMWIKNLEKELIRIAETENM